jgi:Tfp pilus assembly protein PilN
MGALPGCFCWGRALGVYLAQGCLTLTAIASTPGGTKVQTTDQVRVGEGGAGQALQQWLESHLTPRQRRHVPVCIGLAAEQTYFVTRALNEMEGNTPAVETLLAGAAGGDPNSMVSDSVRSKSHHASICSVAACRRAIAEELSQALKAAGTQNARLEPAPYAVLAAADRRARPPRAWKVLVRVLLGEGGGLALLVLNDEPVLWRRFTLVVGQEPHSIASAVRYVEVHAMTGLGLGRVAGVMVQGKIGESLSARLREELAGEVVIAPGEEPNEATYSLALALVARKVESGGINLFRPIRPPMTLGQMFPRKLAAGMALAAAVVTLTLGYVLMALDGECGNLRQQNAGYAWAQTLQTDAIERERKSLASEVSAVQGFLGTRVIWSNYLRDLPTRLPSNACLQSLTGSYEMKSTGKNETQRVNRSLTICGMARFTDRGSAPKEIDAFLESLRKADLLKQAFPVVRLAEIKWRKDAGADTALFTVIASPAEKASKKEKGKEKEENPEPKDGKTDAPS